MEIYIWGTGAYTNNFLAYAESIYPNIVGFVESERSKNIYREKPVFLPAEIIDKDFDYIIVASQFVHEIKAKIYMMGLDLKKIIFLPDVWIPVEIESQKIFFKFDKASPTIEENAVFFSSNGILSTSKKILDRLKNSGSFSSFWKNNQIYDTSIQVPYVHVPQKKLLNDLFIPILKASDTVIDIGCASGEWSRFISNYVKKVDGYDISQNMINNAIRISHDYGFNNIVYTCASAASITAKEKYDHCLLMGVLVCIEEDSQVDNLLKKINGLVKSGGYLVVKDSLSMYTDLPLFYYQTNKIDNSYLALYRPIKNYISLFEKNGFTLVEERYFSSYMHTPIELGSHGFLFRKD